MTLTPQQAMDQSARYKALWQRLLLVCAEYERAEPTGLFPDSMAIVLLDGHFDELEKLSDAELQNYLAEKRPYLESLAASAAAMHSDALRIFTEAQTRERFGMEPEEAANNLIGLAQSLSAKGDASEAMHAFCIDLHDGAYGRGIPFEEYSELSKDDIKKLTAIVQRSPYIKQSRS